MPADRQLRALALVGQLDAVAGVVGQDAAHGGEQVIADLIQDGRGNIAQLPSSAELRMGVAGQVDADVFQRVVEAAPQEVAAQRAGDADLAASLDFVVEIIRAQVGQVAVIQIDAELQFLAQEPRLDEGQLVVLLLGAEGQAQAEFLAGPLPPRVHGELGEVEVALGVFHIAHQRLRRAESGAQRRVARLALVHHHHEVAGVLDVGGLRVGIHAVEIAQPFQALLAELDPHHVEDFARRDRQLAPDHLVLGLGIAANLDVLDADLLAFLDLELEVHGARLRVGDSQHLQVARGGGDINIAFGAVEILHRLDILGHALRGEDVAHVHLQGRWARSWPSPVSRCAGPACRWRFRRC